MNTVGGGIVRYVGVQLLPCPEDPSRVGQLVGPARIELLWQGRVVESFALRGGDDLLVPDGADVAPGTALIAPINWQRTLRAPIPDGVEAVVRWSAPIASTPDAITGLPRLRFAGRSAEPLVLELEVNGVAVVTLAVDHGAQLIVDTGAVVRRGDPLASVYDARFDQRHQVGIDQTTAFLDARPRHSQALIAPRDATVIDIGRRWIVLRTADDRVLRLRRRPATLIMVRVGDAVVAGQVLTGGERNPHALLHAWGEQRLSEHLLGELAAMLEHRVPRAYLALTVRAMLQGGRLRGIATIARDRRPRRKREP